MSTVERRVFNIGPLFYALIPIIGEVEGVGSFVAVEQAEERAGRQGGDRCGEREWVDTSILFPTILGAAWPLTR